VPQLDDGRAASEKGHFVGILTLVKHSLPAIDSTKPPSQWHLSALGRLRCHRLADHLAGLPKPSLFASPEPKASETADLLAERLTVPVVIIEDLHEHKRDTLRAITQEVFAKAVKAAIEHLDQHVLGEETGRQAQQRFCDAIEEVLRREPGTNPIVVAHGTVISLFLARKSQVNAVEVWNRLGLPSFVQVATPGFEVLKIQEQVE
jgi:broad specificity phosphatase PhoE